MVVFYIRIRIVKVYKVMDSEVSGYKKIFND